jgi:hypothetical protein
MLKNKKNNPVSSLREGFDDAGTPDLKYYAFDWDDNLMYMPTKIILRDDNDNEVPMSTEDFAEHRHQIGKEEFDYNGHKIVGYADQPYRNFREGGDKQFKIDAMKAKTGPAWSDFVEAINNGSIFSIITARGHNPDTIKDAIYNLIVSDHQGINKDLLLKNLRKYRDISDMEDKSDMELIKDYLDMNKYYPVSFLDATGAGNPEQLKVDAMREFISYVKSQAKNLGKKLYLKNDVKNNFVPSIGFSDDDLKNVEVMKNSFEDEPMLKNYYTGKGAKTRY